MKRLPHIAGVVIVVLLVANIVAGSTSEAAIADAKARCVAEGWAEDKLQLAGSNVRGGLLGFGGRATVSFVVKDANPPKILQVEMQKYANLLGWHSVQISEIAAKPLPG